MPKQKGTISQSTQVAKFPAWTTLPKQPILNIEADYRVNTDIDVNGVGRVQVKPGYNVNIEEIRYEY